MTSREEKNKVYVDEINKEKTIKIAKIILKTLGIILIIFTFLFLYVRFYEPYTYQTKEYVIKDIRIPDTFNGVKVLHFTDLLYGSTITNKDIEKLKKEIDLINPDIVFFTGNILDKEYEITEEEIKLLNNFFNEIPYRIGKYIVSGNLDNHSFDLIIEKTNFTILNNEIVSIYNGLDKINLIGISYNNDKKIKKDNDLYTITIINNYDNYNKYNITSDIVFAGHNLGGELKPFGIPLIGEDKYLNSYYEVDNSKIYISNGLGSVHKIRFMNKPSMNVYRLYSK